MVVFGVKACHHRNDVQINGDIECILPNPSLRTTAEFMVKTNENYNFGLRLLLPMRTFKPKLQAILGFHGPLSGFTPATAPTWNPAFNFESRPIPAKSPPPGKREFGIDNFNLYATQGVDLEDLWDRYGPEDSDYADFPGFNVFASSSLRLNRWAFGCTLEYPSTTFVLGFNHDRNIGLGARSIIQGVDMAFVAGLILDPSNLGIEKTRASVGVEFPW